MNFEINQQSAVRISELFRILSDPLRIQILGLLLQEEMNVGLIAESLSASPSSISHHLRNLRQLRIVKVRRDGKRKFYSIDDAPLEDLLQDALIWIEKG